MQEILKFIPGFRTKTKWKMIVASIYYLICITSLTSGIGMLLFIEAIPFFIFYGIKALKIRKRKPIMFAIVALIVMGLGMGLMPKTVDNATVHNKVASTPSTTKSIKSSAKSTAKKTTRVSKTNNTAATTASTNKNKSVTGQLKIHYINVGQGDSELIQNNGQNMLIDTGTNASTSSLISYLQNQNIRK